MSAPTPEDLSTQSWSYVEYIAHEGKLYTAQQALDYFALSIFWDKQSTNQVLRMQTMHTMAAMAGGANANGMEGGAGYGMGYDEMEELRKFTGVEFAVVHGRPPGLWVIQKRERLSPEEVRPIASYFILNEVIYCSPTLYSVLSTSLSTSLHAIHASLNTLRAHKPAYNPRVGYTWPVAPARDASRGLARAASRAGSVLVGEDEAAGAAVGKGGDGSASAGVRRKEEVVLPMWNAFQTAGAYITAMSTKPRTTTPEEDEAELDADAVPGSAGGAGARERERGVTRDRESITPAPTGGKRGSGGKAKRRRKSRALSNADFVESPLRTKLVLTDDWTGVATGGPS